MSPLKWLNLFILFCALLIFIVIKMYYLKYSSNSLNLMKNVNNENTINWKW
uniref:ATP synthase complex subunit 8 n=1 Tax=Folsomotoma octooculata TaxID=1334185 RepID=A0A059PIQ5_9HEXA|nr:ATP synthase F0 subunit 8 [Folsomotoma octooculata]AGL95074.1 ATP synthase F0 subunit 8 [Folsomotoma octooculata]